MSEEAKLAYLQEKIKEAKRGERSGTILSVVGIFAVAIGFGLIPHIGAIAGTFIGVGGLIAIITGVFEWFYCSRQYLKLMEQFKALANVMPTCSKCGKQIPQGTYAFCPFCGTSLKP